MNHDQVASEDGVVRMALNCNTKRNGAESSLNAYFFLRQAPDARHLGGVLDHPSLTDAKR